MVKDTPVEPLARWLYASFGWFKSSRSDRLTRKVISRVLHPHSNCVDIGCYRGEILRDILKAAPHGNHYAFEPLPENCSYLCRVFPNVNVHEVALDNFSGSATFHHVLDRPARSGLKRTNYPSDVKAVEEFTVRVDKLDNLIPKEEKIDFVKIDVEGAELAVLQGASDTLKRNRPVVVFEFEKSMAGSYSASAEKIFDLLHDELGMDIHLLNVWLRGGLALSKQEFADIYSTGSEIYFLACFGSSSLN